MPDGSRAVTGARQDHPMADRLSRFGDSLQDKDWSQVYDGQGVISLAHGSFDHDVEVITETLTRIRGGVALDAEVENLRGF